MSVHYEEGQVSYVTPLESEKGNVAPWGTENNSVKHVQPCHENDYVGKNGFSLFQCNTFFSRESGADTTTTTSTPSSIPPSSSSSTSATTSASTSLPPTYVNCDTSKSQAEKVHEISIFHEMKNLKLHFKFQFPSQSTTTDKNESSSTEWSIQYSDDSHSQNKINGNALGIVNSTLKFLLKTVCNMCHEIQIEKFIESQNSEIRELR